MKPFFYALPLLSALAGPVVAAEAPAAPTPSLSDLGHAFKNALTEEETRLLIEYMRDSVLAAFNDEEVFLPPDLAFKLEVLSRRLKKEGNFYLDNLLKQLEADIKRSLKEKMEAPPSVPYETPDLNFIKPFTAPEAAPPPATPAPVEPPAPAPPPPQTYVPSLYLPTPWGMIPLMFTPAPQKQ